MSRNIGSVSCCGAVPLWDEKPRVITEEEAGPYYGEYAGLYVANATCLACGAKYLAWVGGTPARRGSLTATVDLSYRSTFDDEPGPDDVGKVRRKNYLTRYTASPTSLIIGTSITGTLAVVIGALRLGELAPGYEHVIFTLGFGGFLVGIAFARSTE